MKTTTAALQDAAQRWPEAEAALANLFPEAFPGVHTGRLHIGGELVAYPYAPHDGFRLSPEYTWCLMTHPGGVWLKGERKA